jgi:DNA repair exonuclease SbcCD ATPase subunit
MIIAKKERLFQASKEIKEKAKSSRKEMEELREQL